MPAAATIGELRKAAAVTDEQITTAVEAYLADPTTGSFKPADGVTLNLADAVASHGPSAKALSDEKAHEAFRRTMVCTAILLARPEGA